MSEKEAIENAVDTKVVDEVAKTVDNKHDYVEESTTPINNDVENEEKNEEMVKEETPDVEQVPESATPESVEQSVTVEQSEKTISDEQAAAERDVAPEIVQETSSLESNESQEIKVDCDDEDDEDEVETEVETVVKKPKKTKFEIQRQIKRIATNVISIIIWIVGILLLFMCASNLYQQVFNPGGYTGFFGVGEAVVASKSMEPMLYENDLIFYNKVETEGINVGDVVVYKKTNAATDETILIVHEVQQISDGYCVTKGINNAVEDEAFPTSAIVGRYMFKVSQAGKLLNLLTTIWAPILIILIMMVAFAARIAYYVIHKKKTIEKISINEDTRLAIDHFFEI